MIKNCYQLQEHSELTDIDLTQEDVQLLLASFVGKLDIRPDISKNKFILHSHQYVGFIRLYNSKIIIEPKTTITNLNYMISECYNLVNWQNYLSECGSVEEWTKLVLLSFLDSVLELVTKGLNQGFGEIKETSSTIKGSIDFVKQARKNFGYPLQHHCDYTEISTNIIENQIIKLALKQIHLVQESDIQINWKLSRLEKYFINVSDIHYSKVNFNTLNFNKFNPQYQTVLAITKLILEISSPSLEGNSHLFPAFLVDLNRLFERFIAKRLLQNCKKHNELYNTKLVLHYQTNVFLDTTNKIKIIPDLVLKEEEKTLAVIDTKYKLASSESNQDYYQILSYCLAQNSTCGVLVFPNWELRKESFLIKNSNLKLLCLGVILNQNIEQINDSINQILSIIIRLR